MTQLDLFELDDQLDQVILWAQHVKKTRSFFDASSMATHATTVLDIITRRPWTKMVKMGLDYAQEWCSPGCGGCGKNRVDHEGGKLCIEERM